MNDPAEVTMDDVKLAKIFVYNDEEAYFFDIPAPFNEAYQSHENYQPLAFNYALLEELYGNGDDNDGVYTKAQF